MFSIDQECCNIEGTDIDPYLSIRGTSARPLVGRSYGKGDNAEAISGQ